MEATAQLYSDLRQQMAQLLEERTAQMDDDEKWATNPIFLTVREGDTFAFNYLYVIERIRRAGAEARYYAKEKSLLGAERFKATGETRIFRFRSLDPGILLKLAGQLGMK